MSPAGSDAGLVGQGGVIPVAVAVSAPDTSGIPVAQVVQRSSVSRHYGGPQAVEVTVGQPVQLMTSVVGTVEGGVAQHMGRPMTQDHWRIGCCWTCWLGAAGCLCVRGDDGVAGGQVGCAWHSLALFVFLLFVGALVLAVPHDECSAAQRTSVVGCVRYTCEQVFAPARGFGTLERLSPCAGADCVLTATKCCVSYDLFQKGHCEQAGTQQECASLSVGGQCTWINGACSRDCLSYATPVEDNSTVAGIMLFVLAFVALGVAASVGYLGFKRTRSYGLSWRGCC
eukprot:TRINITY_DN40166_c0_g1_i1.p1 TRINITY_DN40166_c0_g1~~TRINITY_DN40166_c0_g1_i1.p1  ORF type:complete len:325 (+),score=68.86 TRINITY_DN40166_c0_g1_i1:125-976(+)